MGQSRDGAQQGRGRGWGGCGVDTFQEAHQGMARSLPSPHPVYLLGSSFTRQVQGKGRDPRPTHTLKCVQRGRKEQAGGSDTFVVHNYLLHWFPYHSCAVN